VALGVELSVDGALPVCTVSDLRARVGVLGPASAKPPMFVELDRNGPVTVGAVPLVRVCALCCDVVASGDKFSCAPGLFVI
jgi:hypothetical protein